VKQFSTRSIRKKPPTPNSSGGFFMTEGQTFEKSNFPIDADRRLEYPAG
jgi:hypothetical protein